MLIDSHDDSASYVAILTSPSPSPLFGQSTPIISLPGPLGNHCLLRAHFGTGSPVDIDFEFPFKFVGLILAFVHFFRRESLIGRRRLLNQPEPTSVDGVQARLFADRIRFFVPRICFFFRLVGTLGAGLRCRCEVDPTVLIVFAGASDPTGTRLAKSLAFF